MKLELDETTAHLLLALFATSDSEGYMAIFRSLHNEAEKLWNREVELANIIKEQFPELAAYYSHLPYYSKDR